MSRPLNARVLAAAGASALLALLVAASPALATPDNKGEHGNPPGNNGTIKVDDAPFDDHPNNEPHVDCVFEIDFYNFDQGDYYADVEFALKSPTGSGQLAASPSRVFIGEDPAGGSDGGDDLDASQQYDLTQALADSGAEPHPKQGYHVKLTIHADGSQGADTKHKVFWIQPCEGTGGEGGGDTGGGDTGGGDTGGGEVGGGNEGTGGGEVGGGEVGGGNTGPGGQVGGGGTTPPAGGEVLGSAIERTAVAAPSGAEVMGIQVERAAPANLARTGARLSVTALLAGLLLALGYALTRMARSQA